MIDFLFALPLWLLAVVLNLWLMGTGIVGLWIARRYMLPRMLLTYEDAYYAAALVQSVMLLYGMIAALDRCRVRAALRTGVRLCLRGGDRHNKSLAGPGRVSAAFAPDD